MSTLKQIKDRLGLGVVLDHLIPKHANGPSYVIGGATLVLFLIQGLTGVILQQYYSPVQDLAYISVQAMTQNVLLNFVRNLHYWGASIIPLLIILHLIRVYISGSYKKPRELLWVSGVLLLAAVWTISFTGTVLRWDQESGEALGHAAEMSQIAGPLGTYFNASFSSVVQVITRINTLHVTILPFAIAAIIGIHVYLIRTLGISSPKLSKTNAKKEMDMVPFSTHIKRMILYGMVAFAVVAVLALTIQAPLSSVANPVIEVSKPDWGMLWAYSIENFIGLPNVPYIAAFILLALLLVPLIDRGEETNPRRRKLMMTLLLIGIVVFVWLTINGALSGPVSHLG